MSALRPLTCALLLGLLLPAVDATAQSSPQKPAWLVQSYPQKPVWLVVPHRRGEPADFVGRIVAENLADHWKETVIVDNRGGDSGVPGTRSVARSEPDGYTLVMAGNSPIALHPHLAKVPRFDVERDLAPVSLMVQSPLVLVVHPSAPAWTVDDLVRLAKRQAGGMAHASPGTGGLQHLAMVMLESATGLQVSHHPYAGAGPALEDLLGGVRQLAFDDVVGVLPHVQAGRLRALAVSSARPSAVLRDIAPLAKSYPGFDLWNWLGLYLPAGAPQAIVDQLSYDVSRALTAGVTLKRLNDMGADVIGSSPEELARRAHEDSGRYGRLVRELGLAAR
jgi:tripartite-type tricarboxylate transporter receptor subunit TctC